ncbi:MAG TPA: 2-oxoacid:acceptor oxidoreductase family protein [Fibrobacteria bacterium]|nr:2-oxoacid:acceptor oxidoreductase family protein [Fibrobacteria bacterium]
MIADTGKGFFGMRPERPLNASEFMHLSSINETPNQVLGDHLIKLEDFQDFADKGTHVKGGNAGERNWTDKNFVPVTLATQCIDCLHCVVACPHHSIGYEVSDREVEPVFHLFTKTFNLIPGMRLDGKTESHAVKKGATNYNHCKGCFVCASACPTGAIHFVPAELVDMDRYKGRPITASQVAEVFKAPSAEGEQWVQRWIQDAGKILAAHRPALLGGSEPKVFNGSVMFADFAFQARFDSVSIFPITPNTSLLKQIEDRASHQAADAGHHLQFRPCLSEESGYAWLTGSAVRGKRSLMAQGSQSLAQIYEFMNINPGLHLPIFMLELTRALSPGTTTKPDHTTTFRTSDTGEIILFGRGIQDDYDKAFLLLKVMESKGVWIPGRLVVKGFVETHTLTSERQGHLEKLSDADAEAFLGRPKNPFVFDDDENRSVGILDMDSRYAEQRQAIDEVLLQAGKNFDQAALELSRFTGRPPVRKVGRFPESGPMDFCVVGLNDPDMSSAEYVASRLNGQGVRCGVVSINLYRPFPAADLRKCLEGCKAVAVVEYNNWSGRSGGGILAQEVRSALYDLENPPYLMAATIGLGGRAVTIPYWVTLFRMLADAASGKPDTRTHAWLKDHAPGHSFVLGTRGNPRPRTDAAFDIPLMEEGVRQIAVVGKGGQGLLQLNSVFTGVASIRGQYALSMAGFGALQRGGGITLSIKQSNEPIRDWSDIIMADTIMAFDGDVSLEPMLGQLCPGGTLILDGEGEAAERYRPMLPEGARMILIPAKRISRRLYGSSARTNMILCGAMLANMGVDDVEELLGLLDALGQVKGIEKEAKLLLTQKNREAILAGFMAYRTASQGGGDWIAVEGELAAPAVETLDEFRARILPPRLHKALGDAGKLRFLERIYALKKSLYQAMFRFHPTINQVQSMYITLNGKGPLTAGDMACAGCGQINIFRTVFNYLGYLQQDKGKIYVSEQDGCGTVISGLNRTSIWNLPYVRIAFETAHGVASGLSHNVDKGDIVVSISGDGGFMQGLRSVEDALHQQDPIFHIVVINQTLGNTGGQATSTTMTGAKTRDGHVSRREPVNFLKYAEKYCVQGAVASTVHLSDLYAKIKWGHHVVREERKPFLLLMHFSCLEQGINLARSMGAQKMAMDAHFFNLYSLRYHEVKNRQGKTLYLQKRTTIDWFPWTFTRKQWKDRLRKYYGIQKMMSHSAHDETALERDYWLLRGEWKHLAREMGFWRFHLAFLKNMFSVHRATLARLIKWEIPKEAGH